MKKHLRIIVSFFLLIGLAVAYAAEKVKPNLDLNQPIVRDAHKMLSEGRQTFRFDTFGDEAFWGDTLRLHQAIAGAKLGGVGPGVSPKTALSVGLKVDAEALPRTLVDQIKAGAVNLDDPATTLALLRLNAVVGITGILLKTESCSPWAFSALCATPKSMIRSRPASAAGSTGGPTTISMSAPS